MHKEMQGDRMLKFLIRAILMLCGLSIVGCKALTSTGGSASEKAPEPTTQASPQIQGETIPIIEARQLEGKTVRVSGTVTVQSGAYASSISSGFAIQDETAGIYVIDDTHSYKLGQKVTVAGTVGTEYLQRNIMLEKSTLLSGTGTVIPRPVQTGYVGDAEGGYLITTKGKITKTIDDGKYGHKLFIDDGSGPYQVFINASTELIKHATSWKPGDVIRVVGFAGRYNDVYEIMPRILPDIQRE